MNEIVEPLRTHQKEKPEMSFVEATIANAKRNSRAKKLNKYIQSLNTDQRIALNVYLMSGDGGLPKGSNLNDIIGYLMEVPIDNLPALVEVAADWVARKEREAELALDTAEKDSITRRELNLNLGFQDGLDPTRVIVLSRDVHDDSKLALQEIDVDSGNFVPIPPAAIASILRDYASSIEERQELLNRSDF